MAGPDTNRHKNRLQLGWSSRQVYPHLLAALAFVHAKRAAGAEVPGSCELVEVGHCIGTGLLPGVPRAADLTLR
jgi:hypothetical protein